MAKEVEEAKEAAKNGIPMAKGEKKHPGKKFGKKSARASSRK